MFEPQRSADNKQWKRKDQKRPCIAKRTISSKKMLYAIFFNSSGSVVQVPCPSGHTITGRFYKNSVLKKVKEFYNKKRPSKRWSGVHLLHDNASSHKSFLASEKVKVLNHPPYSPDLNPCDFFLFPRLKKMLPASVAQLDAPSDWRPGGRGFNPSRGRQHSFVEIDHEIFSTVILSLPLIQEGQLSVSGERMCTILVNHLED